MVFRLILIVWCAVSFVISYHLYGNVVDTEIFGSSIFGWMARRWREGALGGVYYYWVALIPAVTAWLIWRKREELHHLAGKGSWIGVLALAGCLLLHWVGVRVQHPRLSLVSVVGLGFALPWAIFGRRLIRPLFLPVSLLVFCIPLNFLDVLNLRLRVFVGERCW